MTRRWYAAAALAPLLTLTVAVVPASVAYAAGETPGGSGPGGGSSPGGGSKGVHIVPDRNGGTSGVAYSPPRRSTPSTGSGSGRSGTGDPTGQSSTGQYPADTPDTGDSSTDPQAPDQSAPSADPVRMGQSKAGAQPRAGQTQNSQAQDSQTQDSQSRNSATQNSQAQNSQAQNSQAQNSQAQNDPAPAPNPAPRTELTITIAHSKVAGHDGKFTLTCHNAGGSHPDAVNGCAKLDQMSASGVDPFAPISTDTTCTQQFGGPVTATVVGSWAGRPINATFSRSDGCQIKRWNELMPVLPPESTS